MEARAGRLGGLVSVLIGVGWVVRRNDDAADDDDDGVRAGGPDVAVPMGMLVAMAYAMLVITTCCNRYWRGKYESCGDYTKGL
jgi:hypothetical protein